jgi:hypothetical protein
MKCIRKYRICKLKIPKSVFFKSKIAKNEKGWLCSLRLGFFL